MTIRHRYPVLLILLLMLLLSLACTLGGAETPATETPTQIAQVTTPPPTSTLAGPTNTLAPSDTPTPTPSITPTPIVGSGPGGCVLKSTFIADVTIPDGTVLAPNAPFVKTWRIRNNGTCSWDSAYQLVFSDGNQMSGPAGVSIPAAAPNQTIDISVNLAAPGSTGDFTGRWRLRASNNAIFGGFTVVIKVVGTPTPTPTASATPTLIGGGLWGGVWDSTYQQMNLVQTGNTVVGTYANGEGTLNGSVSGNRLSGTWTRSGNSGTFDFWIEGSGLRWHGNWDKTNAWCGHRTGQTDLSPCGVSTWYGTWTSNCESAVPCGDITMTQSGDSVSGSFNVGSLTGAVNGPELVGTWTRNPGAPTQVTGNFHFYMSTDGRQFQGNYNMTSFWCGHRSGASDPTPCLR